MMLEITLHRSDVAMLELQRMKAGTVDVNEIGDACDVEACGSFCSRYGSCIN